MEDIFNIHIVFFLTLNTRGKMVGSVVVIGVASFIAALLVSTETFSVGSNDQVTDKVRILFVGDTSFGENYQTSYKYRGGKNILELEGYDYSLQHFGTLLRESDLVIANLETPVTNITRSPLATKKTPIHWSDVEMTPHYLEKYNIKVVSLANNHAMDFGNDGLKQTLDSLHAKDINSFGAGLNEDEANEPYVREFDIADEKFILVVIGVFEYGQSYDERYSFYAIGNKAGVSVLSVDRISQQVKEIKKNMPDAFVIVFPHWGQNYKWKSERQTDDAHRIIDAGADMIIGHGAHMIQEIENHKGRWIIYSLGNFVFNSDGRYQALDLDPVSMIAQLSVSYKDGMTEKYIKLYPIFSDNRITNFQPRFLNEQEFEKSYNLLLEKSSNQESLRNSITTGRDQTGYFLQFSINNE